MTESYLNRTIKKIKSFYAEVFRFCNAIDNYMVGSLRDPKLGGDLPFAWILRSILSPLSFFVRATVVIVAPLFYLLDCIGNAIMFVWIKAFPGVCLLRAFLWRALCLSFCA